MVGTETASPCRAYIVYHHGLFAQGMRSVLETRNAAQIVGMESDVGKALKAVQSLKPEVIIVEECAGKHQPMRLGALLNGSAGGRVVALSLDHDFATVYERNRLEAKDPADLIGAIRGPVAHSPSPIPAVGPEKGAAAKETRPVAGPRTISHGETCGVKVVSKPTYEVREAIHAHLSAKYSSFMPEFTEFVVGPSKVRLDKRIMDGVIRKPGRQAAFNLTILWVKLLRICTRIGIPAVFLNIAVVLDEAVREPLHISFENESDDLPWGYIFFPPAQLKSPAADFAFILLHELCHCLLDIPDPKTPKEIYDYEFLADVLSLAAFREVFSPRTRQYRETVKSISYVAADEMKGRLGPKVQREILRDPHAFLRKMRQAAPTQPDERGPAMSSGKAE